MDILQKQQYLKSKMVVDIVIRWRASREEKRLVLAINGFIRSKG